jgi:hypothetical protein
VSDPGERAGVPRWLKMTLIAVAALVLVVVAVMLVSGGHKIPNHGSFGDTDGTPTAVARHQPPQGGHE